MFHAYEVAEIAAYFWMQVLVQENGQELVYIAEIRRLV